METLHQANDIIADRYRIVNPLGRGQSSSTYEAEDLTNNQRVALKVLSLGQLTDWKVLELFEREAKILSLLDRPGIPKYLNYFHSDLSDDRRFYLVQELLSGESLFKLVQKGWHPSEKEVQGIAIQVLEILDYLHSIEPPVIHGNIKPQNLMRTSKGKMFLVDFGAVQDVYRNTLTRGETFAGKLGYMPLEQLSGSVVPGSDLYSLGATLLFLLTGRSPEDLPQLEMKIDFRSRVQIKATFADWLEKMLAPAISDRFQSATEAKEGLQGVRKQRPAEVGSVDLKYRQPANSDIFINKTARRIVVKLSYYNFQHALVDLMIFISGGLGFILGLFPLLGQVITRGVMVPEEVAYGLTRGLIELIIYILLPLLMIGIILMIGKLFLTTIEQIWGRTELEIGMHTFIFRRKLGDLVYKKYQGKTAKLRKIKAEFKSYKIFEFEREKSKCVIWDGVSEYSFNISSREECEWLVAELSDFLSRVLHGQDRRV